MDFDDLTKRVHALIDSYKPTHIFVEMSANGVPLYQQLHKKYERGIHAVGSNLSKQDRASRVMAYLQSGRIMFPQKAPWLAAWENEIFSFPSSMYDDQVDTLVYFADQAQRGFGYKAEIEWFKRPPPGRLFS